MLSPTFFLSNEPLLIVSVIYSRLWYRSDRRCSWSNNRSRLWGSVPPLFSSFDWLQDGKNVLCKYLENIKKFMSSVS